MAKHVKTTINLNETAILGLLSDKARYGYELDKIIKERCIREWTDIAFSSIYAILKGLEDKGCVESSSEIARNRVRRKYSITRQGRKTLRTSTTLLLSEPSKTSDSLMAGLANKDLLPDEDVKQALKQRTTALRNQLSLISEVRKGKRGKDKAYFEALIKRGSGRVSEELRFVEEMLGEPPTLETSREASLEPLEKIETAETVETEEAVIEVQPEPERIVPPPAPDQEDSQLSEQPDKGPEEHKQTLF